MVGGYVSGAILAVSGIAGILVPRQVGAALDIGLPTGRAVAELRIAYGAFGAIGVWSLIAGEPALFAGIGVLWLGAAAVRLLSLGLDRPRADASYWAILGMEIAFGFAGVLGNG